MKKIKLKYYSKNKRGVHAACDIKKGEMLLKVPISLILTYDRVCQMVSGSKVNVKNNYTFDMSEQLILFAVYFMQEMHQENIIPQFQPVIDLMPTDLNDFPVFFSLKELENLKGSLI